MKKQIFSRNLLIGSVIFLSAIGVLVYLSYISHLDFEQTANAMTPASGNIGWLMLSGLESKLSQCLDLVTS